MVVDCWEVPMTSRFPSNAALPDVGEEIAAVVRAGCFPSAEDAMREAVQTLLALNPYLRREAAIRRYLDEEITLGRAAELAGMTRWRFRELLAQRGIAIGIEVRSSKELDESVARIQKRRR
jgi:predicted HTH domain antitoxin